MDPTPCFGVLAATLLAQNASIDAPVAYVASIKDNNVPDAGSFSEYSPASGRLTATTVTIGALLRIAYRVQPYQLVGAPDGIDMKRYDIAAKAEGSPPPTQQALLQAVLKDRFRLTFRNEIREMPVLALVLARGDRRLGAQLIKSSFDCEAYRATPHPRPEPGRTPNCAMQIGLGVMSGKAISLDEFATRLAPFVDRSTINKMGLTGGYEYGTHLDNGPRGSANTRSVGKSFRPFDLYGAHGQLGLKLVPDKSPVPVFLVDRLEPPSPN